ncbi:respiratory chain complex I subunit 1 family protein [Thiothrix fructosivorans]|jgi:NADH-quinone oxidoreductase subunit H|uniref:NADH-quinone oxidoreductase subunit H n=1 Tax=Thiothrix fructosivorans TaxID=111770 RepID=A0A8B0SL69_9GAMM|nr:complex I subunit 1 family protein [Thiothrix fructosivorans]MBO0613324.1 NADH-quinone oxidoreductase subunit H [Thiothrix fructosivorans]QTX11240.1 NADH-quinone oxidoreductase subunit H [Thiothrix fructosivorans]
MEFEWMRIPWALLTLFIVINYGLLMTALVQKIGARVGRRHGIPIWQNYIDMIKNYALRTSITHGVMFYLGPVFRLSGGVGLLLFVPSIYGSEMFANFSFAGDLILALYFVFFGTLGMALGAAESGHPYSAIGITRGLSQMTAAELPFALAVFAVALQYQTLSVTEIVAAQQGGVLHWTLFTNPLAVAAAMMSFLGSMMRPPFDVVLAPQEIPIGPPTEYHSSFLAMMQTNRALFPVAKIVVYMNLFFGGAGSWPEFFLKVFLIYMVSAFVGVVFPRFRVEQSIRWFLIWAVPLGILAVVLV